MSEAVVKPGLSSLHEKLIGIVGPNGVSTDPDILKIHSTDWYGVTRGRAVAVIKPTTTEEVSAIVRFCNDNNLKIVPQGGKTGVMAAGVPVRDGDEVIVSLARMNRILDVNPVAYTMTVEAGVILQTIQETAAEHDRYFPLSLGAQGSCMIGGNISTNAGGVTVLYYGNTRAMVLGLEVVLPDGRIWNGLRALKKDNTGYDLKSLFIGAEGTLGIVTKAVIKIFPKAKDIATAWIAVPGPAAAMEMLSAARAASGDTVTSCELVPRLNVEHVLKFVPGMQRPLSEAHEWSVLMEWSSPTVSDGSTGTMAERMETFLAGCLEKGLAIDATIAQSQAQARNMWAIRESGALASTRNPNPMCSCDVSVAIHQVASFIERCNEACLKAVPGIQPRPGGHVGDGNIHYTFTAPLHITSKADFAPMVKILSEIVCGMAAEIGGSFSAEHGIGSVKVMELEHYRSDVELDMMRAIKKALDPRHVMNPGKVIRVDANEAPVMQRGAIR